MTNSIDSNRSTSSPATQGASTDESVAANGPSAEPTDAAGTDRYTGAQSYFVDTWDDGSSDAEDFMSQASANAETTGASGAASADTAGDASVSVLELQAQTSTLAAGGDTFSDNPMADKLAEVLGRADVDFDDIKYCTDNARNFGPINRALSELSASKRKSLAEIVADPEQGRAFFREALQGRDDIPDGMITDRSEHIDAAADALLEECRGQIVADFNAQVAERVRAIVSNASQPYRSINATGESRRAFLGQLARLEGDAAKLEQRLTGFGLDEDAAGDIAQVLSQAHGDPQALEALMSGEAGPERDGMQVFEENQAYAFAEEVLQEELADKLDMMEQFDGQASSGKINGSLLVNDNFKSVREQVMAQMDGGKGGPIEAIVDDFAEGVESDMFVTDLCKVVVAVSTAVGVTVATAGLGGAAALGAGLATGAVESAPDVLVAWEDVDLAEMAAQKDLVMPDGSKVEFGMTDDAVVDKARHNRNVTTAFAVAGLVLGAAPALKGIKEGAAYADDAFKMGAVAADALKAGGSVVGMDAAKRAVDK